MSAGRDFVALVRLSTKGGPGNPHGTTLAMPGETCERVPESSLAWLERGKRIRRVVQRYGGPMPSAEAATPDEASELVVPEPLPLRGIGGRKKRG